MLILQNISYIHSNKEVLFDHLHLTVEPHHKIALVGNNGTGKSTLLKIIAKELLPAGGQIHVETAPYYVPQIFGQYNHLSIVQALRVEQKLYALHEILNGLATEQNLDLLDNDWTIEERCREALGYWGLSEFNLMQTMESLSGGQKTKVFLAGISVHQPRLILLDEPTNHLDVKGRQQVYEFVRTASATLVIVSHDRKLLQLADTICELDRDGIKTYGGNYAFYAEQKQIEHRALSLDVVGKEKALRKAKEKERETAERQHKLDARGKKKQVKAGVARIMLNTLRNKAENSTSKLKSVHAEKINGIAQELQELRTQIPDPDKMKLGFERSALHHGKIMFAATGINFSYSTKPLWKEGLSFEIVSGERIALKGSNGSGKTTLIKLILGELQLQAGTAYRAEHRSVYIDQDYSWINNKLTVYQQAEQVNGVALQESEIKTRLNRFLFSKADWDKPCRELSGGEKMRLLLCCLTIQSQAPDLIILDEPTNNLDLQSVEILTAALTSYKGTLLVVSHDVYFLKQIGIKRTIELC